MVHFSVATEYRYIFSKSKTTMETFWLQCVAFKNKKMPPGFADMPDLTTLHKGATVEVKGRLRNIKFTDSNLLCRIRRNATEVGRTSKP